MSAFNTKKGLLGMSVIMILASSCGQGTQEKIKPTTAIEISDTCLRNFDTTFVTNAMEFTVRMACIDTLMTSFIIYRDQEAILSDTLDSDGVFLGLQFTDFNRDGYLDIIQSYTYNHLWEYLILFDPEDNQFKEVQGFVRFPKALPLYADSHYYFSYHSAGCADANWVSDLFYLDNFKAIQIGRLYGRDCESDPGPPRIEIYKVFNNDEAQAKTIETLAYTDNEEKFTDKWLFIEKYWNKNYRNFK